MDFIKKNFLSILVLIFIIILFFYRNPFGCIKPVEKEIVYKTDTIKTYVQQPPVYIPQYIPTQTSSQPVINIPPQYIPSNDISTLVQQYKQVVDKFLALNSFKDSVLLKDSLGVKVGIVNINDEISENKILSRKVDYQLKFPITTIENTITIKEKEKPVNKWFVLTGITGNSKQIVNGGNIGIGWLNKKDQFFYLKSGIQTIPNQSLSTQFEIGTAFKIKLK